MAEFEEIPLDEVRLADGRVIELADTGPAERPVLVFHHGTPGTALQPRFLAAAAHRRGWRFLTFSRPGYGASTRKPGRRVADVVADTAAVLDACGVDRAVVAGWSGGGPHALACAAGLADRVSATLVMCGVAPSDAHGLEFMAGMGQDNVEEFGAAISGEPALRTYLEGGADQLRQITAGQLAEGIDSILADVDKAYMSGELGEDLATAMRHGLATTVDGWLDDDLAFVAPWGFDVATINGPVSLWQGQDDLMVPFAHGQWLAARIPAVRSHLEPGQGHLSMAVGSVDRMLDELGALAE